MKTEVEKLEKNKVKIDIEVPTDILQKAIAKAYKSISKKVSIPGFRMGKVPKKVIDTRMGKEVVYSEMLQDSISDFYNKAIDVSGIEPVTQPEFDVEIENVNENAPFKFSATVEVKPEVELGGYIDLDVKMSSTRVTKKNIEKAIDEMRNRLATLNVIDKEIEEGDYALIDFQGFQNGEKLKEGADAQDYLVEVGSKQLLPEFEKNLIGHKKGEELEFTVKIPKDHFMKDISGKKVDFKVKIKEVKEKQLPEKDDKFAQEMGDYKSLSDLEKKVKENIKKRLKREAEQTFQSEILRNVVENSKLDVPDKMVENRVNSMMNQFTEGLHKQGISLDEYLEATNSDLDKIKSDFKKDALDQIKSALVLEAIAKKEKVDVDQEEIDKEFEESAKQLNTTKEKLYELTAKQGDMQSIRNRIIANKTVDLLIEKNIESSKNKKAPAQKKKAKVKTKKPGDTAKVKKESSIKKSEKPEKKKSEITEAKKSEENA